jgi:hypothetical protein
MSVPMLLTACLLVGALGDAAAGPVAVASRVLGYVGPGAGLSMLGALLAVVCVVLIALLAPLLYPIRWLRTLLWQRRERLAVREPSGRPGEGPSRPADGERRPVSAEDGVTAKVECSSHHLAISNRETGPGDPSGVSRA